VARRTEQARTFFSFLSSGLYLSSSLNRFVAVREARVWSAEVRRWAWGAAGEAHQGSCPAPC
jgi:hypothetical protein